MFDMMLVCLFIGGAACRCVVVSRVRLRVAGVCCCCVARRCVSVLAVLLLFLL